MRIILVCSVWTANSSDTRCPTELGCYCFEGYVSCSGSSSYPTYFPNGTTHISLFSINADEIPGGTMDNIPYLESYELYQSKIKVIKRGAFSNIKIKTFSLYNLDVGDIESFAFNNISNVESFSIYGMTVKTIHSYAFSNFYNVQTWGMSSVDLATVQTYSFYNFSVETFQLFNSVVGDMKRGAIAHVDKINDYELHTNEFGVLECGTVEPLLRMANISSFFENVFQCDCKLAWLLHDERVHGYLFANWCEMPNTKEKVSLENFDIDSLACDWANDGCDVNQVTSPSLVTSSNSVDTTSTQNSFKNDKTEYISETVKLNTTNDGKTTKAVSMDTKIVSMATDVVSKEVTSTGGRQNTQPVNKNSTSTLSDKMSTVNGENTRFIVTDTSKTLKYDTSTNEIKSTSTRNKNTKQTQREAHRPANSSVKMMTNVYVFVILSLFSFI